MPVKGNNKTDKKTPEKQLIQVDPNMEDMGNHPFFKKKLESAKAFLKKAGLPKHLVPKHR